MHAGLYPPLRDKYHHRVLKLQNPAEDTTPTTTTERIAMTTTPITTELEKEAEVSSKKVVVSSKKSVKAGQLASKNKSNQSTKIVPTTSTKTKQKPMQSRLVFSIHPSIFLSILLSSSLPFSKSMFILSYLHTYINTYMHTCIRIYIHFSNSFILLFSSSNL
jgi:hypothetical protein